MKVGVIAPLSNKTADAATMARACEERGFESFFVGQHTAVPIKSGSTLPSGHVDELPDFFYELPAPFVALSFAAAVTTRIKLGTAVCLVAEHHPLELAKTVSTLDRYSNGRVILGIGSGWNAEEAALFGIDFSRRWAVTRDYVRAMIKVWTQHDASYEGEFVKFPLVRQYPKPVQKPYPPIHIGAYSDVAIKDVATYASGWMPGTGLGLLDIKTLTKRIAFLREHCEKQGRDFNQIEISCMVSEEDNIDPRRLLDEYAAAGAHRVAFYCPGKQGTAPDHGVDGMHRRLDEIAKNYLDVR